MRLLHVTDFHFRRRWFEWLAREALRYDACCYTGDFLDMLVMDTPTERQRQVQWVSNWLKKFPGRLFVCSGNHDGGAGDWLKKAARPGVYVDGAVERLDGYCFACCPWLGVPPMAGPEPPSIILAHAPPEGTAVSAGFGCEMGSFEVAEAARFLPLGSLILSGHVHEPRRWHARLHHTWCFNPGVEANAVIPNHIVIDTDKRWALFHRQDGEALDQIRLGSN
ncbi:MAG TPA: metallophosphoesterase [Opitutaceae bacterium]|jgi:Icc-related predicted phosphoesterase|nr:metallophosphoesterase [Opitutaceae bacterium]